MRNYIRKSDRAPYPPEKLQEAVRAVKSGALSGYAASKHYNIPRSTIINRVYDRKGLKSNSLGRPAILSRELEEDFVKNIRFMEKYGFGLTRKELLETVGQYVSANNIKNPFKNGIPGEDWFLLFKKRHNLSIKKPQPVEYARKQACSPYVIYPYFDLLEETMNELELYDKPSHIWNVDETSFSKDPSKSKVVGCVGFSSTRTIASPGKDNTTVLLGCNGLGEKTPPMIVFKGKNIWDEWTTNEGYPGTAYAATTNGWMETAVFEAFFEKVFLTTVGRKRPILLIFDGHATHVGINLIEKARKAQITILKIPPHTSHLLQPLDLAVNKSFKDRWDVAILKWQRLNIGKSLPKKEFAKMLGQIWGELDPSICAAGFRKAGIYPFNKQAVPENKFNQVHLQEWKQKLLCDSVERLTNQLDVEVPLCVNQICANANSQEPLASTSKRSDLVVNRVINHQITQEPWALTSQQSDNNEQISSGYFTNTSYRTGHLTKRLNPDSLLKISLKQINLGMVSVPILHTFHTPANADTVGSQLHNNIDKVEMQKPKIQILEDRLVTFEDLLLMKIKPGTSTKTKRKRMATGAEVITSDDVYKRTLEAQQSQTKKQEKKSKINTKIPLTKQDKRTVKESEKRKEKTYMIKQSSKNGNKKEKNRKYSTSSDSETEIKYDDDSDSSNFWEEILKGDDDDEESEELEVNMASGTEVITSDDVYKMTLEAQQSKTKKGEKKSKMNTNTFLTKQRDKQKEKETNIKKEKTYMIKKNSKNGNKKEKTLEKNRKKRKHSLSSSDSEMEIKYDDDSDSSNFWEEILKGDDDDEESEELEVNMASGTEVITSDDVYKMTLEAQQSETKKGEKKSKMNTNTFLTKQRDKQKEKETNIKKEKTYMIKKNSKNGNKKEKTLEKNRKKRKHSLSSSDSEMEIKYDEELLKGNEDGGSEDLENEKENHNTNAPFCENDWLLVKFEQKKYVKHYVGVVLHINANGSPVVKYTRKKSKVEGDTIFSFPVLDDISDVLHTEDIVSKLPTPAIGRRGQIIFKMSFHSFNIQ